MPALAKLHDMAELPTLVRIVVLRVQLVLLVVRFTTPVNPFRPVTVTVELLAVPARAWTGDTSPVAIEKSTTMKGIAGVE